MSKSAHWLPDGYPVLTPYLFFDDAEAAIALYQKAFNAEEVMRMPGPNDTVGHAELSMLGSKIMLSTANANMGCHTPEQIGGCPIMLCFYVENVDMVCNRAEAAGLKIIRPLENQFYGDRTCLLVDPFGYSWHIATNVEDVSLDEVMKRGEEVMGT